MTSEARHLVLIGMMGSGKTSVGRRLALRLGRPFIDTDRLVEERTGRSVADVFKSDGEPAFRALEAQAVRDTLDTDTWAVVALGGGAVLDPGNRDLAREAGLVVWLQAPARELARRVAASTRRPGGTVRPLLDVPGDTPESILQGIARDREEAYRAAAHLVVDTTGRSPGQVAMAVLAAAGWEVPADPPGRRV